MKKFIGIIGYSNCGKSSIIQSLTGAPSTAFRGFIYDNVYKERIFIYASSPQEMGTTKGRFIKDLQAVSQKKSCRGFICAIQPTKPYKRISMEDIYTLVINNGNYYPYAFVIDPPYNSSNTSTGIIIPMTQRLSRFNIIVNILDGERFPYTNAEEIQQTTNVIY